MLSHLCDLLFFQADFGGGGASGGFGSEHLPLGGGSSGGGLSNDHLFSLGDDDEENVLNSSSASQPTSPAKQGGPEFESVELSHPTANKMASSTPR